MKKLVKEGFDRGLVIGVSVLTISAVLTVAAMPKSILIVALNKSKSRKIKKLKVKKEEE